MNISPEEFFRQIKQDALAMQEALERVPNMIGVEAVKHFKENFQVEGFVDGGEQKWTEVKRRTNPKTKGAARTRKILTGKTADLGRSIKYSRSGSNIHVYSDNKYADVHNEGLNAGRGKGFIMPKRQFIGDSKELNQKIELIITTELDKIIKK